MIPATATHYDTRHTTVYPYHKKVKGKWAYYHEDAEEWYVYESDVHSTLNYLMQTGVFEPIEYKPDILRLYVQALNRIEDYFEYMNESKKDREFVQKVLSELTEKLK